MADGELHGLLCTVVNQTASPLVMTLCIVSGWISVTITDVPFSPPHSFLPAAKELGLQTPPCHLSHTAVNPIQVGTETSFLVLPGLPEYH